MERRERIEGEFALGAMREHLPEALMPLWRNGLAILFPLGGVVFLTFDAELVVDYARMFNAACALYLMVAAVQIVRVYVRYRKWAAAAGILGSYAVLMPRHIAFLAAGTALYALGTGAGGLIALGNQPATGAYWVPFVTCGASVSTILGLNYVWRFVLLRQSAHEGDDADA